MRGSPSASNEFACRLNCTSSGIGWNAEAPFDAIIVTAGTPQLPRPLLSQLRAGGRLVVPVGEEESQSLLRLRVPRLNGHSSADNQSYKDDATMAEEWERDAVEGVAGAEGAKLRALLDTVLDFIEGGGGVDVVGAVVDVARPVLVRSRLLRVRLRPRLSRCETRGNASGHDCS